MTKIGSALLLGGIIAIDLFGLVGPNGELARTRIWNQTNVLSEAFRCVGYLQHLLIPLSALLYAWLQSKAPIVADTE